jgi:adenylate cyclase
MERRLAAIFAADIAGYSRLMGEDEEATVRALRELYAAVLPVLENHGGHIIDTANDADGMFYLGYLLSQRGHAQEGLVWMEKAARLNPFHSAWNDIQMGVALYSLRRFEEAAKAFKRNPSSDPWTKARRAACLAQAGRYEEAGAEAAEVLRQRPDFSIGDFLGRSILLERSEDRELLREGLIKAGLPP